MSTCELNKCEYDCQFNNCGNDCEFDKCKCGFDNNDNSVFPSNYMFGQSYVPIQRMTRIFTPEVGLKMGTIFPELVSPYEPCQSIREIEFIKAENTIGKGCNR